MVFLSGVAAYANRAELVPATIGLARSFEAVQCPQQTPRTIVALTFGQSNAANSGERHFSSKARVFNLYQGRCYPAKDPMLGSEGSHGSVWPLVGDALAEDADAIVFIPAAVGGVTVHQWATDLMPRLQARLREARNAGYHVTHFLWHQGEADSMTPPDAYAADLRAVITTARAAFPTSAFYVAFASRCPDVHPQVIAAQRSVIDPTKGIFPGPNTDTISARRDGCHFSESGQRLAAEAWVEAIHQKR